jgi:hypothetical protein
MDKLSSRERMMTTFSHNEPDRVPIYLYIIQDSTAFRGVDWRDQFERAKVFLEMGLDPVIDIWLPFPTHHPDVTIKVNRWKDPEKGILLSKEFHTPKGILRQVVRETEDWCDPLHTMWTPSTYGVEKRQDFGVHLLDDWNVSRRIEPWVKGHEDLDALQYLIRMPDDYRLDEWRYDAQRAIEFARKHDLLTMSRRSIVGDAFQWFCDIPWFAMQLIDNPGFVEEFFSIFRQKPRWFIRLEPYTAIFCRQDIQYTKKY